MWEGISHAPGVAAKSSLTFALSTASWYRCTRLARSGCLIASSNNVRILLCACFARPPSPRMLLRTLTCAPRMQYKKASIDWFKRESPARVSPFPLSGTNQSNCLSVPCPFLMNPRMFPLSFSARSRLQNAESKDLTTWLTDRSTS